MDSCQGACTQLSRWFGIVAYHNGNPHNIDTLILGTPKKLEVAIWGPNGANHDIEIETNSPPYLLCKWLWMFSEKFVRIFKREIEKPTSRGAGIWESNINYEV